MSKKKMTVQEFIEKVEWEGGLGSLTEYFGESSIREIDDPTIVDLALKARSAMIALEEYLAKINLDIDDEFDDGV